MLSINKTLLIITGVIAAICIAFTSGYSYKTNQVTAQAIKQERANHQSVLRIESIVYQKQIEIQYKTKVIKEYIHEKEKSDSDLPIDSAYVVLIDSASQNTSPEFIDATSESSANSESIPLTRIVSSVVDNYASCNYDKERLRQFQQWAKDNKFDK